MDIKITNYHIFNTLLPESRVERCGLIFGEPLEKGIITVKKFIETPNSHLDPAHNFRIVRVQAIRAVQKTTMVPLGYWHTHLWDGEEDPSPNDFAQMARYPHMVGMVYHWPTGGVVFFNHEGVIKRENVW